jgi:hypothetical protein
MSKLFNARIWSQMGWSNAAIEYLRMNDKETSANADLLADHLAADDPHPQYTTDAEAGAIADARVAVHEAALDPHAQYTTDAEAEAIANARIAVHTAALNPHPQYTTDSESTVIARRESMTMTLLLMGA